MPGFPTDPSKLEVGLAFGADLSADPTTMTYTPVTSKVQPRVTITRGRIGDSTVTQPSTVDLSMINEDGEFSPRNITGPHYGQLRRNTPMRVRVDTGSGFVTRGYGVLPDWNPTWAGPDIDDKIQLQGAGVMRRLGQGRDPASALKRTILAAGPLEYWTLEDPSGAEFAVSAVGKGPLRNSIGGAVNFGAVAGPAGSASLPEFVEHLAGDVISVGSTTSHTVECIFKVTDPSPFAKPLVWFLTGGTIVFAAAFCFATAGPGPGLDITLQVAGDPLPTLLTTNAVVVDDGEYHHLRVELRQNGANIDGSTFIDGVAAGTGTLAANTLGRVSGVRVSTSLSAPETFTAGHVALWNGTGIADHTPVMRGYVGELASTRVQRLCDEEGIIVDVAAGASEAAGPQPVATILDLLRDCETADEATLLERRTGQLGFDPRSSRYNDAATMTLLYTTQVGDLSLNDDDRNLRNDVTVTRPGGGSLRAQLTTGPLSIDPVTGAGGYPSSVSRNVATDDQASNHAYWLVSVGTVDEPRYVVYLNLRANPGLITQWLACDIGSRVTVNSPPPIHTGPAPLDLVIEGYVETLDAVEWSAVIYTLPYRPYLVPVVESSTEETKWRMDTATSTLTAGIAATALSASVATTGGNLWTTTGGDFPLYINIGGEKIRVDSISGAASPQTFTIVRGVDGVSKAQSINAPVSLCRPARLGM
jgi:hypothetical protein